MIGSHDAAEFRDRPSEQLEIGILGEVETDAEIGFAVRDRRLDLCASVVEREAQLHAWIGHAEFPDRARHQIRRETAHHRDGDLAATQALELLDLGLRPGQFLQGLADMSDQDLAGCGQDQLLRQPLKNGRPELHLQREDLATDRGSSDVQAVCRLADRPGTGDFVDIVQQTAVKHGRGPRDAGPEVGVTLLKRQQGCRILVL